MKLSKSRVFSVHKVVLVGIFLALAIILSVVENFISLSITFLPPGIKLGLSNIITMYCLFFLGRSYAVFIVILKSVFVLLSKGTVAFFCSLFGGVCAIFLAILLLLIFQNKLSYLIVSVFSAISHNMGQLVFISIFMNTYTFFYSPILIVSGIICGSLTSIILKSTLPFLSKINFIDKKL